MRGLSFFFLFLDLQCNEKILAGVLGDGEAGPFKVHKGHG